MISVCRWSIISKQEHEKDDVVHVGFQGKI